MAEITGISWADATHNEWLGCTEVSPGCERCYARHLVQNRFHRTKWGKGENRILTSEANRRKPYGWDRKAAAEGRRWRVFCSSLSDVFDEEVHDDWRYELFAKIWKTPNLDWLLLTKRMRKMYRWARHHRYELPPNIWWGVSAEDQARANNRLPDLAAMREFVGPDAVLFMSAEPLLGPIRLADVPWYGGFGAKDISWAVVGGESDDMGEARPMEEQWAVDLLDEAGGYGMSEHFKQLGHVLAAKQGATGKGKDPAEWHPRLRVQNFPVRLAA